MPTPREIKRAERRAEREAAENYRTDSVEERKAQRKVRLEALTDEQREKRNVRVSKRKERYRLRRKERKPAEFDKVKIVVDGEEKQLSEGSKYLLDQLIKD